MFNSLNHRCRILFPGCVSLLIMCAAMLTPVSASELPAQDCCGCCPCKSQPQQQRTNADRVNDFYQSAREQQAQQDRAEAVLWRYAHPRFSHRRGVGYGAQSVFSGR